MSSRGNRSDQRFGHNSVFVRNREKIYGYNDDTPFVGTTRVDFGAYYGSGEQPIPNYLMKSGHPDDIPDQEQMEEGEKWAIADYGPPSGMVRPHHSGLVPRGFLGEEHDNIFDLDSAENQYMNYQVHAAPHKARPRFMPYLHPDPHIKKGGHTDAGWFEIGVRALGSLPQMLQMDRKGFFGSLFPAWSQPWNDDVSTKPHEGRIGGGSEMYVSDNSFAPYANMKYNEPGKHSLNIHGGSEMFQHKGHQLGDIQNVKEPGRGFGMYHSGAQNLRMHKGLFEQPNNYFQETPNKEAMIPRFSEGGNYIDVMREVPGYISTNMTRNVPNRDFLNYKSEFATQGRNTSDLPAYYGPWA